jgi:hypothetical protein
MGMLSVSPAIASGLRLRRKYLWQKESVCPFLRFEFVAQPSMGPVVVRVSGRAGTKHFLKTVWRMPEASI